MYDRRTAQERVCLASVMSSASGPHTSPIQVFFGQPVALFICVLKTQERIWCTLQQS